MKSIRLNKTSREAIALSMVRGFEQNWLKQNYPEFTNIQELRRFLEDRLEAEITALWLVEYGFLRDVMKSIPEPLLSGSSFSVSDGVRVESRMLPRKPGKRNAVDVLLEPSQWDTAFTDSTAIREKLKQYDLELKGFRKEVDQILDSVNTTGKLVEIWAAAEQYIPAYLNEPGQGIHLPVLHTSRLDEALGVNNA